ncbi:DUF7691 family protein [Aeoliella sp.]|uniref:DUF7691 family protein n=1 Tax=Aeoliella sp. TaxID=2795800 RepID=UPI003CCBA65B
MSYSVFAYLVDKTKLDSVIGCKDRATHQRIADANEGMLLPDEGEPEERLLAEQSLTALIEGELQNEGLDYLYALEMVCNANGERVDLPSLEGVHWSFFDELGMLKEASSTGLPFPPFAGESRYEPLYLSREQLRKLIQKWDDESIAHEDREVQAARYELLEVLESAADDGLDFIGFYG